MNYFTKEHLISQLEENSAYANLTLDESTVIVSEYGGRILGLFPKESCYNLLWVNSNIQQVTKSRTHEIGGERYWISPERDFFYKKPESFEEWECQSSLDPANYETLMSSETSCTVSSNVFVLNQRTKQGSRGEITRQIKLIEEPYNTGICYCGVEILDDCILYRPGLKINGWSLTQVISGGLNAPGTVLIPTKSNSKPLSYFNLIPDDRLKVSDTSISFQIDVNEIYKLAIRPEDINFERSAKIGYVVKIPQSEDYFFVVKISDDIPKNQSECFDVARNHPDLEIGVIQSYNSESPNKPLLGFGEIELQLKPFTTIDNTSHGKSTHQLFGYSGTKEEILMVVEKYLGIVDPYLFNK
jgi:hypothetical protein